VAARGLGLPTAVIGGGYDNPPLADPMPLFGLARPSAVSEQWVVAKRHEAAALEVANAVLAQNAAPIADSFCELIRPDLSLLASWPFNDHYGDRSDLVPDPPPYLGPIFVEGRGAAYAWTDDKDGARIFAYLRPGTTTAAAGLRALAELASRHNVICAAPGLPARALRTLRERGVQVEAGPVQLAPLMEACDIGLSHASAGIGAAFLAAGVRQIGLPNHREQAMYARTLGKQGLGVGIEGKYGPDAVISCVETLLSDTAASARVKETAEVIHRQFPKDPAELAAEQLRALIF
jgi:UDP:flavonoid glycosyltransferase YjiC (YdhE family)